MNALHFTRTTAVLGLIYIVWNFRLVNIFHILVFFRAIAKAMFCSGSEMCVGLSFLSISDSFFFSFIRSFMTVYKTKTMIMLWISRNELCFVGKSFLLFYTRHYRFILTFNIQHSTFPLRLFSKNIFRFHCFCFDCNFVDELYYMRISHISLILFPCYHIHASKEYPLWLFNNRFIQCFNIYSRK